MLFAADILDSSREDAASCLPSVILTVAFRTRRSLSRNFKETGKGFGYRQPPIPGEQIMTERRPYTERRQRLAVRALEKYGPLKLMLAGGFMMRALREDIVKDEEVNYSKEEVADFIATLDERDSLLVIHRMQSRTRQSHFLLGVVFLV